LDALSASDISIFALINPGEFNSSIENSSKVLINSETLFGLSKNHLI
jgi:hypothetical protein